MGRFRSWLTNFFWRVLYILLVIAASVVILCVLLWPVLKFFAVTKYLFGGH